MHVSSTLHPAVIAMRQRLTEGREKIRQQHNSGSPGIQVCRQWTNTVDGVILDLVQTALSELANPPAPTSFCVMALGGYGRKDLAPYSDIDLMVLHLPSQTALVESFSSRLSKLINDSGLECGFTTRTQSQTFHLAWKDATVLTSLAESRLLFGDENLFDSFYSAVRNGARKRCKRLIPLIEKSRMDERLKFGNTVYLLSPNVKRSRGGLRDIQLVRWIGFVRYGETDLEQLNQNGILAAEDFASLLRGYQFLLRLRNQIHFDTKRSHDALDRNHQPVLAAWYGSVAQEGMLQVEQFMRTYFEFTSEIRYSSTQFVESARIRSPIVKFLGTWLSWPLNADFRIGLRYISATRKGLVKVQQEPAKVLELMLLANKFNRRIEHYTWRTIRTAMLSREPKPLGAESIARFMSFMHHTSRLGELLRRLHELRVVEQIIPAMKHARCLMQFTEYHKYTVDAHCIRSVEVATEFARENSLLGNVYRSIKKKEILHLALLLHDLGKGFPQDHSEVGKDIAAWTAKHLRLSDSDSEMLVFLVHKHLLLSDIAFRFDVMKMETVVKFASAVGSVEALQMLFVLTCADNAAVGPGGLNDWKRELIIQLYQRTDAQFRDENPDARFQRELALRRDAVLRQIPSTTERSWWTEQIQGLSAAYLLRCAPSRIIQELGYIRELKEDKPAKAWVEFLPDRGAVEYSIATLQTGKPIGIFHRITGALSSQGLQILAADIHTQPGNIAWDRFIVQDIDFEGRPPDSRMEKVCETIVAAVNPNNLNPPTFRSVWKTKSIASQTAIRTQPIQVQFDNSTSEEFTIIFVFAYDRRGLLYAISKVLFDTEIVLEGAKISTHLDQVVDVFYVTDLAGKKITEPTKLYMLRQRLLSAIETE
jgi:[protein-PII] uridylyltransferase